MEISTDIKIEGSRCEVGGLPEITTQLCRGEYRFKDGFHYLTYTEKTDDCLPLSKAVIKTDGKIASLLKFSDYGANMNFNPSKPHKGRYRTPFGELDFEIVTHLVAFEIKEDKAELVLHYKLTIAGSQSDNKLKVNFNIRRGN